MPVCSMRNVAVRFRTRLLALGCFWLVLCVWYLWPANNAPAVKFTRKSSNLVIPKANIIEVKNDELVPRMYEDFNDNPLEFGKHWQAALEVQSKEAPVKIDKRERREKATKGENKGLKNDIAKVTCDINAEYNVECLRKGKDVFMPFSFIEKYFEVHGRLVSDDEDDDNHEVFRFEQNVASVWLPTQKYSTDKAFLYFGNYNVESRSRVAFISGTFGVPVSNQWDKNGYIYPIQVAQYGLSHFSKFVEAGGKKMDLQTMLEDGTMKMSSWVLFDGSSIVSLQSNESSHGSVVHFNALVSTNVAEHAYMVINDSNIDSCVSLDIKFLSANASVSLVVEANAGYYVLTYTSDKTLKKAGIDDMRYGLGPCSDWCTLHRDVVVDIKKFLPKESRWSEIADTFIKIAKLEVQGEGYLDNVLISRTCHLGHFKDASDWILLNQDAGGGWPVPATRTISDEIVLKPGWNSAMAQGHGISLLVRAYLTYNDERYLKGAERAIGIYQNLSHSGGVRARFLDKYDWYEEYPTEPPLFVLNGFIYSLFGLYDLTVYGKGEVQETAKKLFMAGMSSLKVMLPLYDAGTGTFYDLRHFTMAGKESPNRARADYHSVHVSQLYYLGTIDSDPIFNSTADRWLGYTRGEWSPHN